MMYKTTKNQSTTLSLATLFDEENDDERWVVKDSIEYPKIKFTNTADYCSNNAVFCTVSEFQEEDMYVRILLQREMKSSFTKRHDTAAFTKNSSRNHAIDCILYMGAVFEFQLHTAYLSLCYFDTFLSKISIDNDSKSWAIHLISMACLSLAAKMEENWVPCLSEFQVGKYRFESKVVQRMELLVLQTLEWKMGIVTPFSYFPCYTNKFFHGLPSQASSFMINKLILAFMKEINLMDHNQYAIASASLLVALDPSLSREAIEFKICNSPFSRFLDIDEIFTCYKIMVQLEMDKAMVLNMPDSPHQSPIHVSHDSGANSSICIKRKSLTFEDVDEKYDDDICKKSRLFS